MTRGGADPAALLNLQSELLLHLHPLATSAETLAAVIPLALERLGARAAHVFEARAASPAWRATYAYPRVEPVEPSMLGAAQESVTSGLPVGFRVGEQARFVHAWPFGRSGVLAIVTEPAPLPAGVAHALRPVVDRLADLAERSDELESRGARAEHAEADAQLLHRMIDSVNACIVRTDGAGRLVFVTASWGVLTREHPDRAVGVPLNTYLDADGARDLHAATIAAVCAGQQQACLLRSVPWRREDATSGWADVALETFRSPSGRVLGAVGTIIDVSERVALEAAYESLRRQMGPGMVDPSDAAGRGEGTHLMGTGADGAAVSPGDGGPVALVVEDNPMNVLVLAAMLRHLGLAPIEVRDGAEALAAVIRHRPSVVFMDVEMAVVDGVEATRRIRSYERESGGASVPIVAVTAYAMPGDAERYRGHGMSDYLSKPVQLDELRAVLGRHVGSGMER
jgi:CheY-like chemotaxis protein